MPTMELTDAQVEALGKLTEYERAYSVLNDMWNDKDMGDSVKEAYAKVRPQVPIRELQERKQAKLEETVTTLSTQLEELKTAKANEEESRKLSGNIEDAVKKYNLTPEGRNTLIEQMQERQNPDAVAVAAWMVSEIPKPAPANTSSFAPQTFNNIGLEADDESMKLLDRSPEKWFDKTAAEILSSGEFGEAA